jgi:hypothetical protein
MNNYALGNFRKLDTSTETVIKGLQFGESDVLTKIEDLRTRNANLDKAGVLCTHPTIKVHITLRDVSGQFFKIEAAVFKHEDGFVTLKSGLKIPDFTIYSVDFF